MNIDEAIKILTCKANEFYDKDVMREADACQLGIEALKLVKTIDRFRSTPYYGLLPGETEE